MKAYTDIEQSKKIAKILPLESADMYYERREFTSNIPSTVEYNCMPTFKSNAVTYKAIPAWSLAALIDILPRFIEFKGDKYYLRFMKEYVEYANDEISITGRCLHTTGNNNLVDACVEMIIKLNELNINL